MQILAIFLIFTLFSRISFDNRTVKRKNSSADVAKSIGLTVQAEVKLPGYGYKIFHSLLIKRYYDSKIQV